MDAITTLRSLLEPLRPQILEAALGDRPPIDLALEAVPPSAHADIIEHVTALEGCIAEFLAEDGAIPCRETYGPSPGLESIPKAVYYRPSERLLLDAIADPHPIILATTVETQRYIDFLLRHCNSSAPTRELWIWRGAAGFPGLERVDEGRPQPKIEIGWVQTRQIAERHPDSAKLTISAARKEFRENGAHFATARDGDLHLDYWWRSDPSDAAQIQILVEDEAQEEHVWEALQEKLFDEARAAAASDPNRPEDASAHGAFAPEFPHALRAALERKGAILALPDAHHFLTGQSGRDGPSSALLNIGALKDIYHRLVASKAGTKIVLLCGDVTLPNDLREEVLRLDLPLPNRRELFVAIRGNLEAACPDEEVVRLSEEAAGMTLAEVSAVLKRSAKGRSGSIQELRLAALRLGKRRHIARSPALELVETGAGASLGGMERFDAWLQIRKKAFLEPEGARSAGIGRPPRGVLLLGIPGSGKSLAAKRIAADWMLPLVRMDMGALRDVWVGSSEARVREALRVVEAMAPCVMWIDEIDKGVSQDSFSNSADLNIRATLLTWMQENAFPVFIVATANKFSGLPPELTRAGRFDARFFFGCPGAAGRKEILEIHIRARGHDPENFDLKALAGATHGFTGAEIEQVILDGLYEAFSLATSLTGEMLERRAKQMQPLIRSAGNGLDELWGLIEDGRVEIASDDMLTRAQVAQLIDPHLYRPIYCRLEQISGFERHHSKASRFLMSSPFGGPAAVVMETGEADWIYVETNVRLEPNDGSVFKALDRFVTLEQNFLFETLIVDHAIEAILFETPELQQRFQESRMFSAYSELFQQI